MKTNKFLAMMLFAVIALATVSCEKEDNDPDYDNRLPWVNELTQNAWFLTEIEQITEPRVDINQDGVIDHLDNSFPIKECDLDNQYIFKKDGTYLVNTFNNVCDGQTPNTNIIKGTCTYSTPYNVTIDINGKKEYYIKCLVVKDKMKLERKFKVNDTEYIMLYSFSKSIK